MEDAASSLRSSVLRAVGWATGLRLVGQLLTWAMTLATIRFLHPQDYGLMAVATAVSGFLQSLSYVGFADAIVQNRRIGEDDLRNVFGLILLVNAGCMLLLCALARPMAWFYDEPRLVPLLLLASLMFVPIALQAIPRAVLEKQLDLRTVSRIELVSNVAGGCLVLALAWAGAGVWSLLSGMLLTAFLRAAGFCAAAPNFPRPRFSLRNISDILRFGGLRTAENVIWSFYVNLDVFIIGKLLGSEILGVYSVSRNIAALPVDKLSAVIKPTAFPAFARVQHDRLEALGYLQKATRLLATLCFPVFFGIAATSPQIVGIVLGPKWAQATIPLTILAIAMALRPVGLLMPSFLIGIGEIVSSLHNTILGAVLFPVAFVIGSRWGLVGVCTAWLIAYPVQLLDLMRRVAVVTRTSIWSLVAPLVPPLAGAAFMYGVVRALNAGLPDHLGAWTSTAALIATGVLAYLLYAAVLMRPLVAEMIGLVRR
jgi:O-antigen/teichoic acid export membrane protein